MDEEFLTNLLKHFAVDQPSGDDEGDYNDFLNNYMHAQNQGIQDDDLLGVLQGMDPSRLKAMMDQSNASFSRNPQVRAPNSNLRDLMRRVR